LHLTAQAALVASIWILVSVRTVDLASTSQKQSLLLVSSALLENPQIPRGLSFFLVVCLVQLVSLGVTDGQKLAIVVYFDEVSMDVHDEHA